jgi:hypothetical protein
MCVCVCVYIYIYIYIYIICKLLYEIDLNSKQIAKTINILRNCIGHYFPNLGVDIPAWK